MTDRARGERGQRPDERVLVRREKELPEDQRGGGPVDEEVVPFDGRPDETRQRHPPRGYALPHVLPAQPLHEPPSSSAVRLHILRSVAPDLQLLHAAASVP